MGPSALANAFGKTYEIAVLRQQRLRGWRRMQSFFTANG
jgi:hypothetical protein